MEEAHKGKIWAWEAELLMKWMEKTGVAERVGPGDEVDGMWKGGWKATKGELGTPGHRVRILPGICLKKCRENPRKTCIG